MGRQMTWRFCIPDRIHKLSNDVSSYDGVLSSFELIKELKVSELQYIWHNCFYSCECQLQPEPQNNYTETTSTDIINQLLILLQDAHIPFNMLHSADVFRTKNEVIVNSSIKGISLYEMIKFCPGRLNCGTKLLFIIMQVSILRY